MARRFGRAAAAADGAFRLNARRVRVLRQSSDLGLTGHAGRFHHAQVNNEAPGTSKRWLLAWLVFGLLAAWEVGALAMRAGGDWGAVLSLAYLFTSAMSLAIVALRAIRHLRPGRLFAPIALSLFALLTCAGALYGIGVPSRWITTAMFGIAYSAICLVASCVALAVAWRRHRVHETHLARAQADRERMRRLESVRVESASLAAAAAPRGVGPLGSDGDFVLPSRPKWEES